MIDILAWIVVGIIVLAVLGLIYGLLKLGWDYAMQQERNKQEGK